MTVSLCKAGLSSEDDKEKGDQWSCNNEKGNYTKS